MSSGLTCPKCQGVMSSYERNGIVIDQCSECRGIFLDRGELDQLLDAEAAYNAAAAPSSRVAEPGPARPVPGPTPQAAPPAGYGWEQGGGHHGKSGHGGQYGKRKKSFLGELFD